MVGIKKHFGHVKNMISALCFKCNIFLKQKVFKV